MESPGEAPLAALAGAPARSSRGARDEAGLLAAVTAALCLWRCRRVGARARALGRPLVANPGNVEIGDDVLIDSRAGQVQLVADGQGRLVLGHAVRIGPSTRVLAGRYVEIGDGTRIGARCTIADDPRAPGAAGEIWIGDGVTLGDGARVLPGAVIGAGAVVAPGAVVSGNVPPGAHVVPGAAPRER